MRKKWARRYRSPGTHKTASEPSASCPSADRGSEAARPAVSGGALSEAQGGSTLATGWGALAWIWNPGEQQACKGAFAAPRFPQQATRPACVRLAVRIRIAILLSQCRIPFYTGHVECRIAGLGIQEAPRRGSPGAACRRTVLWRVSAQAGADFFYFRPEWLESLVVADVLDHLGVRQKLELHGERPRPGVGFRIVDGHPRRPGGRNRGGGSVRRCAEPRCGGGRCRPASFCR